MTKDETDIADTKAVTDHSSSHQDGHRAGDTNKAKTDIGNSKAVTNLGDSHQDGQRPTT